MKISKEEKKRVRDRIINAAVSQITQKGFRKATFRAMAAEAGIADATIYKYFPDKEHILYAWCERLMDRVVAQLKELPDYHEYSFQEQVHLLLENMLELMEEDRAFVKIAYRGVFFMDWAGAAKGTAKARETFLEVMDYLMDAAVEAGELPQPPLRDMLNPLWWDFSTAVAYYWLEDDSPDYQNTTQLIDKTLAVAVTLLQSDLLNRVADLFHFLIREHLLSRINTNKGKKFNKRPFGEDPGDTKPGTGKTTRKKK